MNIQSMKLELMQLLLDTEDANILRHLKEVFQETNSDHFDLSDAQKNELDNRTRLRHEGKLKTSSWNEVKTRILKK